MPSVIIQCPNAIPCLGVESLDGDYPIRNLSAEQPDVPLYYCTVYASPPPALGAQCGQFSALAVAASSVSQADACTMANQISDAAACPPMNPGGVPVPTVVPERPPSPCTNSSCPSGEQCVNGQCAPNQPINDFGPVGNSPRLLGGALSLGDLTPAKACADLAYTGTIGITGFEPYIWSVGNGLPAGLTLADGQITGVATVTGTYTFTVTVQDSTGAITSKQLTLKVVDILTDNLLPEGTALQSYSKTLVQNGGTPPVSWQVASGQLPPGLTLNETTGVISGTPPGLVGGQPNGGGTYNFTVSIQDNAT